MRDFPNTRSIVRMLVAMLFICVSSCATYGASTVEKLDAVTSVTLTAATTPLLFYRDNSGRSAFARNFANLGPIQVNRSGQYRYFLWIGIWGTGQVADDSDRRNSFESPVLFIDGEPFELSLAGWTADSIGASENIYPRPVASSIDAYYEVTLDVIRILASASDVRLHSGGTHAATYEPWQDQHAARASLKDFFDLVGY